MSAITRLERLYNLASIASCAVIILSQCFLAMLLIMKLPCSCCCSKQDNLGKFKYYQHCAISFFLNLCVAYTMLLLSRLSWLNDPESEAWRPFYILYYAFAAIAIVSMYVYLMARLYRTFRHTPHQVNRIQLHLHICIACVGALLLVCVPIIGIVEHIDGLWSAVLVAVVLAVLASMTHLIYLFSRRLYQQVLQESLFDRSSRMSCVPSRSRSRTGSPVSSNNDDINVSMFNNLNPNTSTEVREEKPDERNEVQWSEASLDLLRISRKHSLLGFVMLITSLLATCTLPLSMFCGGDEGCVGIFWCVWYPFHAINVVICGFCLFLSFSTNTPAYKLLCYCCDKKCADFCKNSAKKSINRSSLLEKSTPPPTAHSVALSQLQ